MPDPHPYPPMLPADMERTPVRIAMVGTFALAGRARLEECLQAPAEIVPVPDTVDAAEKLRRLEGAEVIVSTHLTREMARAAPGLRLMHAVGAGVDAVELDALPAGARLANVYHHGPGIAEYVLMGMLAASRDLVGYHDRLRLGDWSGTYHSLAPIPPPFPELRGRTALLLGLGAIGREVAVRAHAFGMRVRAIRRRPQAEPLPAGVEACRDMEALADWLPEADFVVVTLPLTEETRGAIGEAELARMKATAVLVNVARGPVVDEAPLYRALAERRLGGLVCDVWYRYPPRPLTGEPVFPSRYPLHELDNVVMTPHMAGYTEGTVRDRFRTVAENIDRLVRGEPLRNQVYPPA